MCFTARTVVEGGLAGMRIDGVGECQVVTARHRRDDQPAWRIYLLPMRLTAVGVGNPTLNVWHWVSYIHLVGTHRHWHHPSASKYSPFPWKRMETQRVPITAHASIVGFIEAHVILVVISGVAGQTPSRENLQIESSFQDV